jgi:hypothetical protein
MTSEEEWIQRVLRSMVKEAVQTTLRSQKYSTMFLTRIDSKAIGQQIEKITDEITVQFVAKLKAKGYLQAGSNAPEREFIEMFRATMDEYFASFEPDRS